MGTRLFNVIKYKAQKADKIIQRRYKASFMNNTKWYKLLGAICMKVEIVGLNYKLIYDDVIESNILEFPDCYPYFLEPIKYKELEWVEFPSVYQDFVNMNNLKAGKKEVEQDISLIEGIIYDLGVFEIEKDALSLKVFGYR